MRILACVDVSVYAESVVDHAAWAARRTGSTVDLLHVIGRKERGELYDLSGALGPDANAALLGKLAEADQMSARLAQERGRALLQTMRQRLVDAGVDDVTTRQRHGSFVEAVVDAEEGADFVVVGKRGANADFASLHLGSNLERVVRASNRPVLVASRAFRDVGRVLVAYDGGPSAMKAVEEMAAHPLFAGLDCHLVTVTHEAPEAHQFLEQAAERLRGNGMTVTAVVRQGEPEAVIGDYVRSVGIDLLVMGAYGHSRVRHLLVGSTTSAMIRTCLIPVLLYR